MLLKNSEVPVLPSNTLDQFKSIYHDNERWRADANRYEAELLVSCLVTNFRANMSLEPAELTARDFEKYYDPALLTIGVDARTTFMGHELMGLAAHEDDTRVNLIYIHTSTDGAVIKTNETTGQSYITVSNGIMMTPEGRVLYGDFPQEVIIDKLETADVSLLEQCQRLGVPTFQDLEITNDFNDKNLLSNMSESANFHTPRRLARSAFFASDNVDNLVIKPSIGSQGRGVRLTDYRANPRKTKEYYQFLEKHDYSPLVEERIRSFEIHDPLNDERLDWNIRAILSYGELVGMYVRADSWGGPVNMSKTAKSIDVHDFRKYFDDFEDYEMVVKLLETAAQAVAEEHPISLVAADFTVDENMQPYLFELNQGQAGGVQTIAGMQDTYDGVMKIPRKILANFIRNTERREGSRDASAEYSTKLEPWLTSHVLEVYYSRYGEKILDVNPSDIPYDRRDKIAAVMMLGVIRLYNYYELDNEEQELLDYKLTSQYPLELAHFFGYIGELDDRKHLLPYLDVHGDNIEDTRQIARARLYGAASAFDMQQYKTAHRQNGKYNSNGVDMHRAASGRFIENLGLLLETSEQVTKLVSTMRIILYAYCDHDYEAANGILNLYIKQEEDPKMARTLHCLQFLLAAGDKRYAQAMEYLLQTEELFEDQTDLYRNVIFQIFPQETDEVKKLSHDKLVFLTEVANRTNDPLSVNLDIIIMSDMRSRSRRERAEVFDIIANGFVKDAKASHRKELRKTLMNIYDSDASNYRRLWKKDKAARDLSDLQVVTRLIESITNYDADRLQQYINELRSRDLFAGSLDILQEIYIDSYKARQISR